MSRRSRITASERIDLVQRRRTRGADVWSEQPVPEDVRTLPGAGESGAFDPTWCPPVAGWLDGATTWLEPGRNWLGHVVGSYCPPESGQPEFAVTAYSSQYAVEVGWRRVPGNTDLVDVSSMSVEVAGIPIPLPRKSASLAVEVGFVPTLKPRSAQSLAVEVAWRIPT